MCLYSEHSSQCQSGKYATSLRTHCESCAAGTYVKSVISECVACEVGKYNPVAQTDFCTTCAAGSATGQWNGSSTCSSCDAGYYNNGSAFCQECPIGTYSGTRADKCVDCSAGTYASTVSSPTCTSCDAGTYSLENSHNCSKCGVGEYSLTRASGCTSCPLGTYNNDKGKASCVACSSGRYADETGMTECTKCAIGEYQGATSQSLCESCEAGKYVNKKGAAFCISCDTGYHSIEGDNDCTICEEGYYWGLLAGPTDRDARGNYSGYGCEACPDNCKCDAGVNAGDRFQPRPVDGYWIDRTAVAKNPLFIRSVYKCARDTCTVDIPAERRLSTTSDCDLFENYTSKSCQSSDILCATGSTGPLCGACADGYTFSAALSRCSLCGGAWLQVIIVLSVAVAAFVVLWYMRSGVVDIPVSLQPYLGEKWHIPIIGVIASIDSGALKLLWSTFQVSKHTLSFMCLTLTLPFSSNIDCAIGVVQLERDLPLPVHGDHQVARLHPTRLPEHRLSAG